jgi:hypothetical protein
VLVDRLHRADDSDARPPARSLVCASLAAIVVLLAASPSEAATPRLPGIDVSRFQGLIDWPLVGASDVQFAFVQASRGSGPITAPSSAATGAPG